MEMGNLRTPIGGGGGRWGICELHLLVIRSIREIVRLYLLYVLYVVYVLHTLYI